MKRGRNQRRRQGMNINRALDSNGPEVRIRGTANQIYDKYLALARDANSAGDRVKAENYLQHAEHYFRVIRAMQPQMPASQIGGDQQEGEGDQPSLGEGGGRMNRDQQRFEQPQPGYGGDESEFDADQPESRFEPHPFAEERQSDDHRRQDYQGQNRSDHRGGHRNDHRNDQRNEHRRDHRHDNRQENRHRQDHRSEGRPEPRAESRSEQNHEPTRPELQAEDGAETAREPRNDAQRSDGEGRFDNDRRGRRRRRPRPPIGAEGGAQGGADDSGVEGGEVAPETV